MNDLRRLHRAYRRACEREREASEAFRAALVDAVAARGVSVVAREIGESRACVSVSVKRVLATRGPNVAQNGS